VSSLGKKTGKVQTLRTAIQGPRQIHS